MLHHRMKGFVGVVACASLFSLFPLTSAQAVGELFERFEPVTIENWNAPYPTSYNEPFHLEPISCIDEATGAPLNCLFHYFVVGLSSPTSNTLNNGGHVHNFDTHPLIWPDNSTGQLTGVNTVNTCSGSYLAYCGATNNTTAYVQHNMPYVAGGIDLSIFIFSPPGYYCDGSNCISNSEAEFDGSIFVGYIDGYVYSPTFGQSLFQQLPEQGASWQVVRTPDVTQTLHPDAVTEWGTANTVNLLEQIAGRYQELTGEPLSINDMTLIYGGTFDVHGTWKNPHKDHQVGTAADVNPADFNGFYITCDIDGNLKMAMKEVLGSYKRWLLCEPDKNGTPDVFKHINFPN